MSIDRLIEEHYATLLDACALFLKRAGLLGSITDLTFNDDGTRLIGASANGKIYIWGVPSAE